MAIEVLVELGGWTNGIEARPRHRGLVHGRNGHHKMVIDRFQHTPHDLFLSFSNRDIGSMLDTKEVDRCERLQDNGE